MNLDRKTELLGLVEKLELDKLEGIKIDLDLLDMAFRHPSYCVENGEKSHLLSNQRLEFLGDAVLGLVSAKRLYLNFEQYCEGDLTKIRAGLVCEKSLAKAAANMGLGEYLVMGKGISASGGKRQASILADTFEAVLAALFLSGATEKALDEYVFKYINPDDEDITKGLVEDYKGMLQALVQKEQGHVLDYSIIDEQGPNHKKMFLASVILDGKEIGRGWGHTKKEAQKKAAKLGLHKLNKED